MPTGFLRYGAPALGIALLSALAAGCGEGGQPGDSLRQRAQGGAPPPAPVKAIVVQTEPMDFSFLVTGSILPNESVDLHPEASGRITKVYFNEGQAVSTGQLLVKLDDSELIAQMDELKNRLKLAQSEARRQQQLLDIQAASAAEVEVAQSQLGTLKAQIEGVQARIAHTELRAPFAGTIGLRKVSAGSYVTPASSIANLQALNPVKLEFQVPERYVSKVRSGIAFPFSVEGQSGVFQGTVYATEPAIDPTTRTLTVRALAQNPGGKLVPGAFAKINFELDRDPNAILLPAESVVPTISGHQVYIRKGGVVAAAKVETGTRTANEIQILRGLAPGDTVIVTGLLTLKPGKPVPVQVVRKADLEAATQQEVNQNAEENNEAE